MIHLHLLYLEVSRQENVKYILQNRYYVYVDDLKKYILCIIRFIAYLS